MHAVYVAARVYNTLTCTHLIAACIWECIDNPCLDAVCQHFPEARCQAQTCGCKAQFFVGLKEVTASCACGEHPGMYIEMHAFMHVYLTLDIQSSTADISGISR